MKRKNKIWRTQVDFGFQEFTFSLSVSVSLFFLLVPAFHYWLPLTCQPHFSTPIKNKSPRILEQEVKINKSENKPETEIETEK
jgi:hypothetical protein